MGSPHHLQQPKIERKLLQRTKGKKKDGFTPSPTITTMVRKANVLKKNQSFANIVTNLNSHNGYEKSVNLNHDQSKLQGLVVRT
jgi:phosphoglucomutase